MLNQTVEAIFPFRSVPAKPRPTAPGKTKSIVAATSPSAAAAASAKSLLLPSISASTTVDVFGTHAIVESGGGGVGANNATNPVEVEDPGQGYMTVRPEDLLFFSPGDRIIVLEQVRGSQWWIGALKMCSEEQAQSRLRALGVLRDAAESSEIAASPVLRRAAMKKSSKKDLKEGTAASGTADTALGPSDKSPEIGPQASVSGDLNSPSRGPASPTLPRKRRTGSLAPSAAPPTGLKSDDDNDPLLKSGEGDADDAEAALEADFPSFAPKAAHKATSSGGGGAEDAATAHAHPALKSPKSRSSLSDSKDGKEGSGGGVTNESITAKLVRHASQLSVKAAFEEAQTKARRIRNASFRAASSFALKSPSASFIGCEGQLNSSMAGSDQQQGGGGGGGVHDSMSSPALGASDSRLDGSFRSFSLSPSAAAQRANAFPPPLPLEAAQDASSPRGRSHSQASPNHFSFPSGSASPVHQHQHAAMMRNSSFVINHNLEDAIDKALLTIPGNYNVGKPYDPSVDGALFNFKTQTALAMEASPTHEATNASGSPMFPSPHQQQLADRLLHRMEAYKIGLFFAPFTRSVDELMHLREEQKSSSAAPPANDQTHTKGSSSKQNSASGKGTTAATATSPPTVSGGDSAASPKAAAGGDANKTGKDGAQPRPAASSQSQTPQQAGLAFAVPMDVKTKSLRSNTAGGGGGASDGSKPSTTTTTTSTSKGASGTGTADKDMYYYSSAPSHAGRGKASQLNAEDDRRMRALLGLDDDDAETTVSKEMEKKQQRLNSDENDDDESAFYTAGAGGGARRRAPSQFAAAPTVAGAVAADANPPDLFTELSEKSAFLHDEHFRKALLDFDRANNSDVVTATATGPGGSGSSSFGQRSSPTGSMLAMGSGGGGGRSEAMDAARNRLLSCVLISNDSSLERHHHSQRSHNLASADHNHQQRIVGDRSEGMLLLHRKMLDIVLELKKEVLKLRRDLKTLETRERTIISHVQQSSAGLLGVAGGKGTTASAAAAAAMDPAAILHRALAAIVGESRDDDAAPSPTSASGAKSADDDKDQTLSLFQKTIQQGGGGGNNNSVGELSPQQKAALTAALVEQVKCEVEVMKSELKLKTLQKTHTLVRVDILNAFADEVEEAAPAYDARGSFAKEEHLEKELAEVRANPSAVLSATQRNNNNSSFGGGGTLRSASSSPQKGPAGNDVSGGNDDFKMKNTNIGLNVDLHNDENAFAQSHNDYASSGRNMDDDDYGPPSPPTEAALVEEPKAKKLMKKITKRIAEAEEAADDYDRQKQKLEKKVAKNTALLKQIAMALSKHKEMEMRREEIISDALEAHYANLDSCGTTPRLPAGGGGAGTTDNSGGLLAVRGGLSSSSSRPMSAASLSDTLRSPSAALGVPTLGGSGLVTTLKSPRVPSHSSAAGSPLSNEGPAGSPNGGGKTVFDTDSDEGQSDSDHDDDDDDNGNDFDHSSTRKPTTNDSGLNKKAHVYEQEDARLWQVSKAVRHTVKMGLFDTSEDAPPEDAESIALVEKCIQAVEKFREKKSKLKSNNHENAAKISALEAEKEKIAKKLHKGDAATDELRRALGFTKSECAALEAGAATAASDFAALEKEFAAKSKATTSEVEKWNRKKKESIGELQEVKSRMDKEQQRIAQYTIELQKLREAAAARKDGA